MRFLLLLAGLASEPADTIPFSTGEIAIRGGWLQPVGTLADLYEPAAQGGVSLVMAHWASVRTRLDLSYARLGGSDPLRFVLAAAGYDWRPDALSLELGASLGLFHVRSDPDPRKPRLADGGESEFGFCARVGTPVWIAGPWVVRIEGQWLQAFTNPHPSAFAWGGLSVGRRAW